MSEPGELKVRERLWERLLNILRRHVYAEDQDKSDDEFIRSVFKRYLHGRGIPLIDPNE